MTEPAPPPSAVIDPERALVLAYAPAARRAALATLWRLDERMGNIVGSTREVMIGRIRLAWWRESLEALDTTSPPAEPLLREIAERLLPFVTGADLATIEPGWAALVDAADAETIAIHGAVRGGRLFALAAQVLGSAPDDAVTRAGEGWALAELGHRLSDPALRALARGMAAERLATPVRWPRALRPLGALTLLARCDAAAESRRQGSPGRVARTLLYRLTGR